MKKFDYQVIKKVPYSAIIYVPAEGFHQLAFFKIAYIENGSVEVEFKSRTGGENIVKNCTIGDAFIISPKDIHKYTVNQKEGNYRNRDIYISPKAMKYCCDFVSPKLYDEIVNSEYPYFFKIDTNELLSLGEKLSVFINSRPNEEYSIIHRSIVVSLLGTCYIYKTTKNLYPEWIQDLLRNLSKKKFIKLPIADMMKITGYSHSYISKVFKQYFGVSLKTYVNGKKLAMSTIMLVNGDASIENIADSLGFKSTASYFKAFKAKYNMSPGQYRRTMRDKQTSIRYVDWGTPANETENGKKS